MWAAQGDLGWVASNKEKGKHAWGQAWYMPGIPAPGGRGCSIAEFEASLVYIDHSRLSVLQSEFLCQSSAWEEWRIESIPVT